MGKSINRVVKEKLMHTLAEAGITLSHVGWGIVIFVAGALVGVPLWKWSAKHMPWNRG